MVPWFFPALGFHVKYRVYFTFRIFTLLCLIMRYYYLFDWIGHFYSSNNTKEESVCYIATFLNNSFVEGWIRRYLVSSQIRTIIFIIIKNFSISIRDRYTFFLSCIQFPFIEKSHHFLYSDSHNLNFKWPHSF